MSASIAFRRIQRGKKLVLIRARTHTHTHIRVEYVGVGGCLCVNDEDTLYQELCYKINYVLSFYMLSLESWRWRGHWVMSIMLSTSFLKLEIFAGLSCLSKQFSYKLSSQKLCLVSFCVWKPVQWTVVEFPVMPLKNIAMPCAWFGFHLSCLFQIEDVGSALPACWFDRDFFRLLVCCPNCRLVWSGLM